MEEISSQITLLLRQAATGDSQAQSRLMSLVYSELHRLAAHYMRGERPDHTLQPTALVHEAFLKLIAPGEVAWQNRAHFFATAAQAMRRILIDHARQIRSEKRQGQRQEVSLDSALVFTEGQSAELLALDEALDRLHNWDLRQCRIVEMRFFGGLSEEETAAALGVSTRTVKRDWTLAKTWLYRELARRAPEQPGRSSISRKKRMS